MGKRTKDKTDDEIRTKIRRLEDELRYRQNVSPINYQPEDPEYNDCNASSYNYREELDLDAYLSGASVGGGPSDEEGELERRERLAAGLLLGVERPLGAEQFAADEPVDTVEQLGTMPCITQQQQAIEPDNRLKSMVIEVEPNTSTAPSDETSVPTEILAILGEAKKTSETFGKKIPCEVSERWGQILVEGLAKEQKDSLLTKSLIPEHFQLAKAPKLNAEVTSVLPEAAKYRDKRLEKMQNQLGSGIASLANFTSELINKDLNKMDIIKSLSETNQILLNLHYEQTMNRRRLIIQMLDKNFNNIIQGVKRDDFLFGNNLGDTIKTSKSIERSSLQIKKPFLPQASTFRKPAGQQGNSRAPPRHGSGSGSGPAATRAPTAPHRFYPPPPPPAGRRPPPRRPPQPQGPSSRPQDRRGRR